MSSWKRCLSAKSSCRKGLVLLSVLFFAFLIIMMSAKPALSQCVAGSTLAGFQKWIAHSCDAPIKVLQGTIVSVNPNISGPWYCPDPDGDWNIFVMPDPGYSWILKNLAGDKNSATIPAVCGITFPNWFLQSPTSLIECEVKSSHPSDGIDLRNYFYAGMKVQARGYWVDDGGHDDKTELHPLLSIWGGDDWNQKIFVAQDRSDRFVTDDWPISEHFDFDISSSGKVIRLTPGLQSNNEFSGTVLHEKFYLDHYYYDITDWRKANASQAYAQYLTSDGKFEFNVNLNPAISGLFPFYLGTFEKYIDKPVLLEQYDYQLTQVTVNVNGSPRFDKQLKIIVTVTLQGPPDDLSCLSCAPGPTPVQYSNWTYFESGLGGIRHEEKYSGHSVQLQFLYYPEAGYSNTSWNLEVMGSTRKPGWSPGDAESFPQSGVNGEFTRRYFHDKRSYYIVPSKIGLAVSKLSTSSPGPDNQSRTCLRGYDIDLKEDLITNVAWRKLGWDIQETQLVDGTASSSPATLLPASGRLGTSGATVELIGPKKLRVSFKDYGWEKIEGSRDWKAKNKNHLIITAKGVTELGENLVAATEELALIDCPEPRIGPPQGLEILPQIEKVIAAMIWLQEHGLLPTDPPWPGTALDATRVRQGNPLGLYPLGDSEHVLRRLPESGRSLYLAYQELSKGMPLDSQQQSLVNAAQQAARSLPNFKRQRISTRQITRPFSATPLSLKEEGEQVLRSLSEKGQKSIAMPGMLFDRGKVDLRNEAKNQLKEIISRIKAGSPSEIRIVARVDEFADEKNNQSLAQRRADAIRSYIISQGIRSNLVIADGQVLPRAPGRRTDYEVEFQIK